jgi:membrane associated rhomboid family serine protease
MAELPPLEAILRMCAAAAPVPWYPAKAAAALGLSEQDLMAFVDQLRGGGLVARTDPVPGYGRGYVLTPAGVQALQDPGDLEWLRRGELPPRKGPAAEAAPAAVSERERAVRMSLLAPFTPYVVYGLIAVNVAVFLYAVYLGQKEGIRAERFLRETPEAIAHKSGAIKASDVLTPDRNLVRLLTCCFVHFGLIHIAANMISLYMVGPLLERMWGHVRFLVLYLIAGFGGSCAAVVLRPGAGEALLAGASGAVWGILASMAVWVLLNRRYMPRRLLSSWGSNLIIVFIINVAITYLGSGFISAEAHYGGGIVGAASAVLLHFTRFGPAALRGLAAVAVAVLPVFGLWSVTHPGQFNPEWDQIRWQRLYLPQVKDADKEARETLKRSPADLVLAQNPTRRHEDNVKTALAKYASAIETLRPAVDVLRAAGPFHDGQTEETRKAWLELLEARLELWTLQERALKEGEDWPGKDRKNSEQVERVKELEDQWRKVQGLR